MTIVPASISGTNVGFQCEFSIDGKDYTVSVNPKGHNGRAFDRAYAVCARLAKAVDHRINHAGYAAITDWAKATVVLRNVDDLLANGYMLSDVWAWYDCWSECYDHMYSSGYVKYDLCPDHSKQTVSVACEVCIKDHDTEDYAVRVHCVHRED